MMASGDPPELAAAQHPSVWLGWYFKRGAFTILTLPLFLLLVFCVVTSAMGAFIQGMALLKVSWANLGLFGLLAVLAVGWVIVIIPPVLYYSILKNLPGLWIRGDASRSMKLLMSVAIIAGMAFVAWLAQQAAVYGIGWIADLDPCAAFDAGVTGSLPPTNCT